MGCIGLSHSHEQPQRGVVVHTRTTQARYGGAYKKPMLEQEYGQWSEANPECVALIVESDVIRTFQLCWAMLCLCQAGFMMLQYPRIGWEPIYMPICEALNYGVGWGESSRFILADGRTMKWARFVSWVVTTPVLLGQIGGISQVKWGSFNMNSAMIAADLVMVTAGLTAQMTPNASLRWFLYTLGWAGMLLIFAVVYQIFSQGITKFDKACKARRPRTEAEEKEEEEAAKAAAVEAGREETKVRPLWRLQKMTIQRLKTIRLIFFLSWTTYPIYFLLGFETTCLLSESVLEPLYIISDALAKNLFGILMWNTLWHLNNGNWNSTFTNTDSSTSATRKEMQSAPRPRRQFETPVLAGRDEPEYAAPGQDRNEQWLASLIRPTVSRTQSFASQRFREEPWPGDHLQRSDSPVLQVNEVGNGASRGLPREGPEQVNLKHEGEDEFSVDDFPVERHQRRRRAPQRDSSRSPAQFQPTPAPSPGPLQPLQSRQRLPAAPLSLQAGALAATSQLTPAGEAMKSMAQDQPEPAAATVLKKTSDLLHLVAVAKKLLKEETSGNMASKERRSRDPVERPDMTYREFLQAVTAVTAEERTSPTAADDMA